MTESSAVDSEPHPMTEFDGKTKPPTLQTKCSGTRTRAHLRHVSNRVASDTLADCPCSRRETVMFALACKTLQWGRWINMRAHVEQIHTVCLCVCMFFFYITGGSGGFVFFWGLFRMLGNQYIVNVYAERCVDVACVYDIHSNVHFYVHVMGTEIMEILIATSSVELLCQLESSERVLCCGALSPEFAWNIIATPFIFVTFHRSFSWFFRHSPPIPELPFRQLIIVLWHTRLHRRLTQSYTVTISAWRLKSA